MPGYPGSPSRADRPAHPARRAGVPIRLSGGLPPLGGGVRARWEQTDTAGIPHSAAADRLRAGGESVARLIESGHAPKWRGRRKVLHGEQGGGGAVDGTCYDSPRRAVALKVGPSAICLRMISSTIRDRLAREPFEPFIIRAGSGRAILVARSELAVIMKTEIFVAAPNSDHWDQLPFLHVAGLEKANGNGHRRKGRKGTH